MKGGGGGGDIHEGSCFCFSVTVQFNMLLCVCFVFIFMSGVFMFKLSEFIIVLVRSCLLLIDVFKILYYILYLAFKMF